MIKLYGTFEEVEAEIKEKTPPIVYKYRTWEDIYHKRTITNSEVWFAHPHSLNDPYDVRPPYNFIVKDIDWDMARTKIRKAGRYFEPHLSDAELEVQVEKRIKEMQANPIEYFQRNRGNHILDEKLYDPYGVFSCCKSAGNEPMWAHYGNNHCGFAVGFNTVELARTLQCTIGPVKYDDTPVDYHIFGKNDYEKIMEAELFQKSKRWEPEEELRFITAGIGLIRQRAAKFTPQAVSEIVFGINTSQQVQNEIISEATKVFPNVPFFRVRTRPDGYGFSKEKI